MRTRRRTTGGGSAAGDARAWRRKVPTLVGEGVVLRELRKSDAPYLLRHINKPAVLRYVAPSPSTVKGFETFIAWAHRERRRGRHLSFGIIPEGGKGPVGVIQCWPIELDFSTAEWGFVVDDAYWGTGLFAKGADVFLAFAFRSLGVYRLEARAMSANIRGNKVLRKLGARREGTLRRCFRYHRRLADHVMWALFADVWTARRRTRSR